MLLCPMLTLLPSIPTRASEADSTSYNPVRGLLLTTELQASLSHGKTPLWLNANKYGLSSLESSNGYIRATVERKLENDEKRNWGLGYGLDVALPYHYTSSVVLQQAYAEGRYKYGVLTLGAKQHPSKLKSTLSTGNQILGINSRPAPGVRLALDDWDVPFLFNKWFGVTADIFYGQATDGNFQKDFTGGNFRYCKNTLLNLKSGFVRFGRKSEPVNYELGLEMATQFGGEIHETNGTIRKPKADFWKALYGGKNDSESGYFTSAEGNQMGAWMSRLSYKNQDMYLGLYVEHYFDDDSQAWLLDYDGYNSYEEWLDPGKSSYLLYPFRDFLVGLDVQLKHFKYLDHITLDWFRSYDQSGPIYHDHSPNIPDHIGGCDDYMNHGTYISYSHWGQVIGNPLYSAPLYNDNGSLSVRNNRIKALHFGAEGHPLPGLHYRVLGTVMKGWGTYSNPYKNMMRDLSVMAEAGYQFQSPSLSGLTVLGAVAADKGGILGNNFGAQFTARWNFGLVK